MFSGLFFVCSQCSVFRGLQKAQLVAITIMSDRLQLNQSDSAFALKFSASLTDFAILGFHLLFVILKVASCFRILVPLRRQSSRFLHLSSRGIKICYAPGICRSACTSESSSTITCR